MPSIGPAPVGSMAMKDVCNLKPRAAHRRRLRLGSRPGNSQPPGSSRLRRRPSRHQARSSSSSGGDSIAWRSPAFARAGSCQPDLEAEVDLVAMIGRMLKTAPLAGFVVEGFTPYGRSASNARTRLMLRAVYSGLPVVRVGRGNTEGFVPLDNPDFIGGSNLTATKARLLLIACLMKFGALPPTANPNQPTAEETAAVREKVAGYQAIFNTH